MRIDAHQHFWKFDPVRDNWITAAMNIIQRDFLPADLLPLLTAHNMDGCVAVQADQSELQNKFLIELAAKNNFIKGVVGWVDLKAANIKERLAFYQQKKIVKGFRHVLQGEADRAFMHQPAFINGIAQLEQFGFTYDILIFPDQLHFIPAFVKRFPNQRFVIDHIAKPNIKKGTIKRWERDIQKVAVLENVSCKISGMVTEADWQNWKPEDFYPYLDVVLNAFGTKRIMYGSDWPVCNVAGGYNKVVSIVKQYTLKLTANEQALFWGQNAAMFYNL
jgi:L-fuconolactonase